MSGLTTRRVVEIVSGTDGHPCVWSALLPLSYGRTSASRAGATGPPPFRRRSRAGVLQAAPSTSRPRAGAEEQFAKDAARETAPRLSPRRRALLVEPLTEQGGQSPDQSPREAERGMSSEETWEVGMKLGPCLTPPRPLFALCLARRPVATVRPTLRRETTRFSGAGGKSHLPPPPQAMTSRSSSAVQINRRRLTVVEALRLKPLLRVELMVQVQRRQVAEARRLMPQELFFL